FYFWWLHRFSQRHAARRLVLSILCPCIQLSPPEFMSLLPARRPPRAPLLTVRFSLDDRRTSYFTIPCMEMDAGFRVLTYHDPADEKLLFSHLRFVQSPHTRYLTISTSPRCIQCPG
ncbi:hypothetical protein DL96DRAFT_1629422, partial [Flagelloscypha sp. PMI_526]